MEKEHTNGDNNRGWLDLKKYTTCVKKWQDSFSDLLNPTDKLVNECEEGVIIEISVKMKYFLITNFS